MWHTKLTLTKPDLRDSYQDVSRLSNKLNFYILQVLLLVLYVSLKEGKIDKARRIVRDRCPIVSRHKEKN